MPPFFAALDALRVNDRCDWAGFPRRLFATLHVKRMVNPLQRAVADPPLEIIMHGALRRQILGNRPPLAAGAQHVHHPVDHFANVNRPLVAAGLRRRNQRPDFGPLRISQIARIPQLAAVVAIAVLPRPHPIPRIDYRVQGITADSVASSLLRNRFKRLNLMPDGH
jgi:hypothetical protein